MEEKSRGELVQQRSNLLALLQARRVGGRWLEQTETHRAEKELPWVRRAARWIVLSHWKRNPSGRYLPGFESVVLVCVLLSVVVITLQEAGPDWKPDVNNALT